MSAEAVVFDYQDLLSEKDLSDQIERAFGKNSLGLCLVSNLPSDYPQSRSSLLRLASSFADLPVEIKSKMEHPLSNYSFGWSHGKERMNGKLDLSKGSFYNNPTLELPPIAFDEDVKQKYPQYGAPNIWPQHDLPDMQSSFMNLGGFIVSVGLRLAFHFDKYLQKLNTTLPLDFFQNAIKESQTHKGRLLHYFAMESKEASENFDSWCGIHVDHSLLTGLTSAMFLREKEDSSFTELDKTSTEMKRLLVDSGLFVQSKENEFVKVAIPTDCLAFQIGEAAQISSKGLLKATPHFVKGVSGLERNTFAVFMQPNVDYHLDNDLTFGDFTKNVMKRHY